MRILVIFFLLISINVKAQISADSLRMHVLNLSEQAFPRNAAHIDYLNKAAQYIKDHFLQNNKKVVFQKYEVDRVLLKNVISSVGPDTGYRIIVGANYDVCGRTPGADANASGVAALLELNRTLSKIKNLPYRIDFVAFTLGDDDSLSPEKKGSYMHAKSLKDHDIKVLGMLSLHGIGFYTDIPHSQKYPFNYYKYLHGHRGNFISLYLHQGDGFFPNQIRRLFKQYIKGIKVVSFKPLFTLPKLSKGDQESYRKMGYATVKISNTNAYRNKYYHFDVDTYETLDYTRMSAVVNMLYETLKRYKQ